MAKARYFCPDLVVTPESFAVHCATVAKHYRVLPMTEAVNHWAPAGIDCHEVPGDHDSMVLEPHVRVLGAKVAEVLRNAQNSGV